MNQLGVYHASEMSAYITFADNVTENKAYQSIFVKVCNQAFGNFVYFFFQSLHIKFLSFMFIQFFVLFHSYTWHK